MPSSKITLNRCIVGCLGLGCFALGLVVGKTVVDAVVKAKTIDEAGINSNAPQINRQALKEALDLLKKKQQPGQFYAIPASASSQLQQENTASLSATKPVPQTVEIINASQVTGAAKAVSGLFDPQKTQITIKNNQTVLDETSLLYKNEYSGQISGWKRALTDQGWKVIKETVTTPDNPVDVTIILGRQ